MRKSCLAIPTMPKLSAWAKAVDPRLNLNASVHPSFTYDCKNTCKSNIFNLRNTFQSLEVGAAFTSFIPNVSNTQQAVFSPKSKLNVHATYVCPYLEQTSNFTDGYAGVM